MPKISLQLSPYIIARVGATQERLSPENGNDYSMERMLGDLVVIGLDRIARNGGKFSSSIHRGKEQRKFRGH